MVSKNLVKYIHGLELKKNRLREGVFVAEGPKVVGDLLRTHTPMRLFGTRAWHETIGRQTSLATSMETTFEEVTEDELRKISFLQHPQMVLALFPLPHQAMQPDGLWTELSPDGLYLALDGVQDPGNLGTIIRIADWFGINTIICSHDTADAFNPKVIQATMGSIARVRVVHTNLENFLEEAPGSCPIYGTLLDGSNIYQQQLTRNGIIVMGNEGNGISDKIRDRIKKRLLIPQFQTGDGAESLNVAIATAITCSEFRRQGLPTPIG